MKIRCRIPVDLGRDAGARDDDPDRSQAEIVRAWCERSPDIRPCGKWHAWVEKRYCAKRCRECVEILE